MDEVVYYTVIEAGFESFPAENYVDYMTNVMPVPERHIFSMFGIETSIVCVIDNNGGKSTHLWSLVHEVFSNNSSKPLVIDADELEAVVRFLQDIPSAYKCDLCERSLGQFIRKDPNEIL